MAFKRKPGGLPYRLGFGPSSGGGFFFGYPWAGDAFAYTGTLNNQNWSTNFGSVNLPSAASGIVQAGGTVLFYSALYTGGQGIIWPNDQWAKITLNQILNNANDYTGIFLRGSTTVDTQYRVYVTGPLGTTATLTIAKKIAGVFTSLAGGTATFNIPVGSVLYACAIGNQVLAFINGQLILQVADSTIASGIPGFNINAASLVTDTQISNFTAGAFIPPYELWHGGSGASVGAAAGVPSVQGTAAGNAASVGVANLQPALTAAGSGYTAGAAPLSSLIATGANSASTGAAAPTLLLPAAGTSATSGAAPLSFLVTAAGNAATAGAANLTGAYAITAAGKTASAGTAALHPALAWGGATATAGAANLSFLFTAAGNTGSAGAANVTGSYALTATGESATAGAASVQPVWNAAGAAHTAGAANLTGSAPTTAAGSSATAGAAFMAVGAMSAGANTSTAGSAALTGSGAVLGAGASATAGAVTIAAGITESGRTATTGAANLQPALTANASAYTAGAAALTGSGALQSVGQSATTGAAMLAAVTQILFGASSATAGRFNLTLKLPGQFNAYGDTRSGGAANLTGSVMFPIPTPATVTPLIDQIFADVRAYLQTVVGASVEIFQGLGNRVPSSSSDSFIVMTALGQYRLATNVNTDVDGFFSVPLIPTQTQHQQSMRFDIQLDFYGPNSGDWVEMVATLFRDPYSCDALGLVCQPLYADDANMSPLITAEKQYLERWQLVASVQVNPVVVTALDFSTTLNAIAILVDARFRPGA